MKESHNSWIHQFICRHKWRGALNGRLREHWLMVVIFFLFVAIVLCMINLIVMVLTT